VRVCKAREINTDSGHTDTPMLKGQIKAFGLPRKMHDRPGSLEAGFSTTDAFKVPNEQDMAYSRQDHEIATISGYMGYFKKKLERLISARRRARGVPHTLTCYKFRRIFNRPRTQGEHRDERTSVSVNGGRTRNADDLREQSIAWNSQHLACSAAGSRSLSA
jgi:hypothetical protein